MCILSHLIQFILSRRFLQSYRRIRHRVTLCLNQKGSEEARLDVVQFVNSFYYSVSIREMFSKLMSQPVVIFHRFTTKLKTLRDWGWDIDTYNQTSFRCELSNYGFRGSNFR